MGPHMMFALTEGDHIPVVDPAPPTACSRCCGW